MTVSYKIDKKVVSTLTLNWFHKKSIAHEYFLQHWVTQRIQFPFSSAEKKIIAEI